MKNYLYAPTKIITVSKEVKVPDFSDILKDALTEMEEQKMLIEANKAIIESEIKSKVETMITWFIEIFQPFINLPTNEFRKVFHVSTINATKLNIDNEVTYSASIYPTCTNSKGSRFEINLCMNRESYLRFTFWKDNNTPEYYFRNPITKEEGENFFKWWGNYKIMIEEMLLKHIKGIVSRRNDELYQTETMLQFLDDIVI